MVIAMVRKSKEADATYMRQYRAKVRQLIFEEQWRIRLHADAAWEKERHGSKAFEVEESDLRNIKASIGGTPTKYIYDRVIPRLKRDLPEVPTVWIEKQLAEYTKDPLSRSTQKASEAFTRLCEYWQKKARSRK